MYLQTVKSKNATSYYAAKTYYDENGKKSSKIVEKLGTLEELSKLYEDPKAYLKQRIAELTAQENTQQREVLVKFSQTDCIATNEQAKFNCGYLFLQQIYHELKLDKICETISKKYNFEYDLNAILSRLVYGRILSPSSKLSTMEYSKQLLEQPNFDLHQIYRALEILQKENYNIQAQLYKNSANVVDRKNNILYYDCTNYFFEIEDNSGIRQYGVSKESRPNPIVEMGLFMDGDGIPLAFCIHPGNTSEQKTLIPLERTIIRDFEKSKLVVCTDAGLSSNVNRRFNSIQNRAFITVQSLKKMKESLKDWALDKDGWKLPGSNGLYNLDTIEQESERYKSKVFYKETWEVDEHGLEQRFIVTFSLKYKEYLEHLREKHIQRAQKAIDTGRYKTNRQTDPNRFIDQYYFTATGEIAVDSVSCINEEKVRDEAAYDGFYCVATNLEDPAEEILKVNSRRWEIEESFRIMKSEFKARPVYLQKNERIEAHFLTCFLALTVFRILEKKLSAQFTAHNLIDTLRKMELYKVTGEGFVPIYTRTEITDALHDTFGFRTDYKMNSLISLKNIFKTTKQPKH